jgi:hypothetical protein
LSLARTGSGGFFLKSDGIAVRVIAKSLQVRLAYFKSDQSGSIIRQETGAEMVWKTF